MLPRLGVSYSVENKLGRQPQSSPPLNSAWGDKELVNQRKTGSRPQEKNNTKNKRTAALGLGRVKSWRSRTEQKFTPTYWSQQSNTRSNKLSSYFCVQTSIGSFSSTDRYHIFHMINGNQKVGFDLLYVQVVKGKIWTPWWESRIDNWMTSFDPTRQETACKFLRTLYSAYNLKGEDGFSSLLI